MRCQVFCGEHTFKNHVIDMCLATRLIMPCSQEGLIDSSSKNVFIWLSERKAHSRDKRIFYRNFGNSKLILYGSINKGMYAWL